MYACTIFTRMLVVAPGIMYCLQLLLINFLGVRFLCKLLVAWRESSYTDGEGRCLTDSEGSWEV